MVSICPILLVLHYIRCFVDYSLLLFIHSYYPGYEPAVDIDERFLGGHNPF